MLISLPPAVYLRSDWTQAWVLQSDLQVNELVWSAPPSIPTATLSRTYGRIRRGGPATSYANVARLDCTEQWIKIVAQWDDAGTTRSKIWYGRVVTTRDKYRGQRDISGTKVASGTQIYTAYGLAFELRRHPIEKSWWQDISGTHKAVARAITFNDGGERNCKSNTTPPSRFAVDKTTAIHWSSRRIVQYTLEHDCPMREDWTGGLLTETRSPKFVLSDPAPSVLSDWDKPEVTRHNRTPFDVLNDVLNVRDNKGWDLVVDETATPHEIKLVPFTYNQADLALPNPPAVLPLPANKHQLDISFDDDPTADLDLHEVGSEFRHQTVVRGARETGTATAANSGILVAGWPSALQTAYLTGASGNANYGSWSTSLKKQRNQEARQSPTLDDVFSRFQFVDKWDGKIDPFTLWFPNHDPLTEDYPTYDLQLKLRRELPFVQGVDLTGGVTATVKDATRSGKEFLPSVVYWRLPESNNDGAGGTYRFVDISKLGLVSQPSGHGAGNHKWSGHVTVDGRALRVRVSGEPQHVLESTVTLQTADDKIVGNGIWENDLQWVVTVEADHYAEGRYPANASLPTDQTIVRKLVNVGNGYRLDHVAAGTILGVVASTGALITQATNTYLRDDRAQLNALAQSIHEWANTPRQVMRYETDRLTLLNSGQVDIGTMVNRVGMLSGGTPRTVDTVVTEIRLAYQPWSDRKQRLPRLTLVTQAGQFDFANYVQTA